MKDILAKLAALESTEVTTPTTKTTDKKAAKTLPSGKKKLTESLDESYSDDEYDENDEESMSLYSGCYVIDTQDGSGEIFKMRGDPHDRRVWIGDRHGRGWNIHPSRLKLVDENDPRIQRYFGNDDDIDEGYDHSDSEPDSELYAERDYKRKQQINKLRDPRDPDYDEDLEREFGDLGEAVINPEDEWNEDPYDLDDPAPMVTDEAADQPLTSLQSGKKIEFRKPSGRIGVGIVLTDYMSTPHPRHGLGATVSYSNLGGNIDAQGSAFISAKNIIGLYNPDENIDEATNHMGEKEYTSWHGWKAACRKAHPGCGFRGDRDIGAATLGGRDVGEWDGEVGSVYNKPAGPDATEMNEDEQIDEISGATLGSYVQKARQDAKARAAHGKELDADPKVAADQEKISGWYKDRRYTKSGASVHRSKIDKARDRIETRKKKIDPDYPASASSSKRHRGVEKAINKMQYGNLTDSVDNVVEAKAPSLASKIKNAVWADQISKDKEGNYIFRKGYYYRNGMDEDKWAARIAGELAKAGLEAQLVDSYDHWAAFNGGASLKNSSHFAAVFKITDAASEPVAAVTEAEGTTEDPYTLGMGYFSRSLRKEPEPKNPFPQDSIEADRWEDEFEMGKRDRYNERCESVENKGKTMNESAGSRKFKVLIRYDGDRPSTTFGGTFTIDAVEDAAHAKYVAKIRAEERGLKNVKVIRATEVKPAAKPAAKPAVEEGMHGAENYTLGNPVDKDYTYQVWRQSNDYTKPGGWVHDGGTLNSLEDAKIRKEALTKGAYHTKAKITRVKREHMAGPKGKLPESADPKLAQAKKALSKSITKNGHETKETLKAAALVKKLEGQAKKTTTEGKIMTKQTFIIEGVRFRASPSVAKILRRFPHEATNFDMGSELDDNLFDALYDHYLNNGEMPYGVAKSRDGDPYDWVSNKLHSELDNGAQSVTEDADLLDPEIQDIFDKYPYEAKQYKETGELDDSSELYNELFDHFCNNGEMPYGVAKARDGDPLEWIENKLKQGDGSGLDSDSEYGADEPASNKFAADALIRGAGGYGDKGEPIIGEEDLDEAEMDNAALALRKAKLAAQDKEWAAAKARVDDGRPKVNPFADEVRNQHGDELAWRSQSGKVAFHEDDELGEDSFDPTQNIGDEDVLVEMTEAEQARIIEKLSNLGLDEGLDFFFDNNELVVIGRATARVVINAVGGFIQGIDGEEVRIGAKPKTKVVPDRANIDQLAAEPEMFESKKPVKEGKVKALQQDLKSEKQGGLSDAEFKAQYKKTKEEARKALKENVILSVQADGEEDVMSVLRRLSGMSATPTITAQPVGIPSMMAAIDSIQADDECEPDYSDVADDIESEVDAAIEGTDAYDEVDECEYANEPDPVVQTGLDSTIRTSGNEPGRRAYTAGNVVEEAKRLTRQYDDMKKGFKK